MTDAARVQMRGISKRFGAAYALREVDLDARTGEIHALMGENGAGKSTLMRVLAGAITRDAGRMEVDGEPYTPRNPHDARVQGIRAVHQELSLVPQLSAAENLLLGEMPTHARGVVDWATAYRVAQASLERLGFEGIDVRQRVDRLGVSQRQMIEIAKAFHGGPRVIVLDEPSAVLSNAELVRLFAVLRTFRDEGGTVIYVSHRLDEVLEDLRPRDGTQGRRGRGHGLGRRCRRDRAHPHDGRAAVARDLPAAEPAAAGAATATRGPVRPGLP